jgi:hypothetical protein
LQLPASLHEYALEQPHLFAAADVSALQRMQDALAQSIASGKEQTTLTAMFRMLCYEVCFVKNMKMIAIYHASSMCKMHSHRSALHAIKSEIILGIILQYS